MKATARRMWFWGIGFGLGLLLLLTLNSSRAACDPQQPDETCSTTYTQIGEINPVSGRASSTDANQVGDQPRYIIDKARLATTGQLIYLDHKRIEEQAHMLLADNKQFRETISPHLGKPAFDRLIRQFDYAAGFNRVLTDTNETLQQRLDRADRELRKARDLYAYLAVYADEARFRADPVYAVPCGTPDDVIANTIDWCNFAARMRQSVREIAYLRMIFGQQFTVDSLGLHFDAGEIIGGEAFVRDEVRKLQMAVSQYELAQTAVTDGLYRNLGSGCYVADFYTTAEWSLLSRALDGKERAQFHIATRKSYLDDYGPESAQGDYHNSAADQYIALIGTAASAVRSPSGERCVRGTRPDGEIMREMVANILATRESSRQLREGRNIFGFDIHFTPARPYLTAIGSPDKGLWEEAMEAAQLAKTWQNDEISASRQFDQNEEVLKTAIRNTKDQYDARLRTLTGCSRNNLPSDEAFFTCVDTAVSKLQQCLQSVMEDSFNNCVAQAFPGLVRSAAEGIRSGYLRIRRVQASIDNIPKKIENERWRNTTVQHAIYTNGEEQSAHQFALSLANACSVGQSFSVSWGGTSAGFSLGVSINCNPLALNGEVGRLQKAMTRRQAIMEMQINDINSDAAVRNQLLELAELQIDREVAVQEFKALATQFEMLVDETKDVQIEAQRARAYLVQSPANDPSYRLVRDSARLRLASQLEYAARVSYMATRRAEYEYAARLNASNFRISDIYRTRTADDILRFLTRLRAVTDNLIISDAAIQQEDFKVSVALHVLGLTDQSLGLIGDAARAERLRRFRAWVAQNTRIGTNGKPVLSFKFTTSIAGKGIFSNVIQEGYDRFWLHKLAGIGQPKAGNIGFGMNLISAQAGNLRYRRVVVTQAGVTHLRTASGCIFDYHLIHPAALLGLEWPANQPAEAVTTDFKAHINNAGGERTPAFLARPVSASDWQVDIFAGTPEAGLSDMDLQQLTDIELHFSTTRASRQPGEPHPSNCVRGDF